MANYANLKAAVNAAITTNGNNEITGAILNDILNSIISTIGANYTLAGVVTPSTTISAPDANVFWIGGAGTYTQFGGTITIAEGNIGIFIYNGSYTSSQLTISPNSVGALTMVGYYTCQTASTTAAKAVSATGYILRSGGCIKILMTNRNDVNNATLNINNTGAKPLYYKGRRAGLYNSWDAGTVIVVFYDGTNYYADSSIGSTGLFVPKPHYALDLHGEVQFTLNHQANNSYTNDIFYIKKGLPITLMCAVPEAFSSGSISCELWYQKQDSTYGYFSVALNAGNLSASRTITLDYDSPSAYIRCYSSTYRGDINIEVTTAESITQSITELEQQASNLTELTDITDKWDVYCQQGMNTNGVWINLGTSIKSRIYKCSAGDELYIVASSGTGISQGSAYIVAFSSIFLSTDNIVSYKNSAGVSTPVDEKYTVPEGVEYIAITSTTNKVVVIHKFELLDAATQVDITDGYTREEASAYFKVETCERAGNTKFAYRSYAVKAGDVISVNYDEPAPSTGIYLTNGKCGDIREVTIGNEIGGRLGIQTLRTTFVVPDGYTTLVCNILTSSSFPKIYSNNSNYKDISVIELNDIELDGLLNSKKRSARNYNNLTLVHFSDIHGDDENLRRIIESDNIYRTIDGIVRYDDIIATGDQQKSQYANDYYWWANANANGVLAVIGNHETWEYYTDGGVTKHRVVSEQLCYEKYIAPYVSLWGVVQPTGAGQNGYYPCYYHKDYTLQGVRMIVLDCMHYTTDGESSTPTETTAGMQDSWFRATLADARSQGLSVLVVSHYQPATLTFYNDAPFCRYDAVNDTLINPLAPAAVQDFIDAGGDFVMWIGGHVHSDRLGYCTNYPSQLCYLIDTACSDIYNSSFQEHARFTRTRDCFNYFTVDTVNKVVKFVRVGSHVDTMMKYRATMAIKYLTKVII